VPAHTLNDVAEYTLLLAKLWVVATVVRAVLESPRARSLAGRAVARVPAFGREGVREAVALLATLALALVAAVRLPPPAPLFAQAIDGALPPSPSASRRCSARARRSPGPTGSSVSCRSRSSP